MCIRDRSYTTQLYFDFSGYSDMAIGVSRLFGIVLPLNFNSPYKAASISDFWRRWHMTLSRFLRDYLYISLGGSRKGPLRRQANLMVTMLLGGLWHGASWNFVLWGGLHGIYLVINHAWRAVRGRISGVSAAPGGFERLAGWGLTFVAVVIAWVFFRAPTLAGALNMLRGMLGMHGFSLPAALAPTLGGVADSMRAWGVEFQLGGGSRFVLTWAWTLALLAVALFLPNTQQLMRLHRPGLDFDPTDSQGVLEWKPNGLWAWALAVIAAAGVLSLSQATEFLYYQF